MFDDVWPDFAGRLRGPNPGQIATNVSFGNFRGARIDDVPRLCQELSTDLQRFIIELDGISTSEPRNFVDEQVLRVAAYAHCVLVRIHPFVNGNGRTSRACINYFLSRFGYLPMSLDRPAGAYLDATRTFLQLGRVDHFVDFLRPLLHLR